MVPFVPSQVVEQFHLLRDRVKGILASEPFSQILRARGIAVVHVTEHSTQ